MRILEEQALESKLDRLSWRRATSFTWTRLPDSQTRRQLNMLVTQTRAGLPDNEFNELQQVISEMKDIYSRARVCPYHNRMNNYCDLSLEPDLTRALAHTRDYEEQLHLWKAWRDSVGPPIRSFRDAGQQERSLYEDEEFESHIDEVWATVAPLYRQLHTYVRRRLIQQYGSQRVRPDGPIPAHLLGNMWAQNWKNLADIVLPYPGKQSVDVTPEMLRQGYTPLRMFQLAEEFYTSMGMNPMPPEFWHHSMLEKPLGRDVVCRASAWDFCNHNDYRIKQCTEVTMEDLQTIHHEMAHIQYYLQYANQPLLFRDGANPGFHEAVGAMIELSVITPRHLQRIGLLNNITDEYGEMTNTNETNINFLLTMALDKVAYLPFAYVVDQWRWRLFSEEWKVEEMNSRWWDLRMRHQGIIPPIPRSENDFDPAAKYHVVADMPYISEILSMGSSRSWSEIIHVMTKGRTDKLDSRPLLEYFQPLAMWLSVQNRDEKIVGWATNNEDSAGLKVEAPHSHQT
uniref:Angiotensin-converting enzyme n=1 Tax=Timema bartmani TaxID=61472 RepID=A0A7R9EMN5_9NEOP|nr:unnamed protein product [Timema bartmani]